MAGNENETLSFLVKNLNKITLKHLGLISKIQTPTKSGLFDLNTLKDVAENKTEDADKKADVLINDYGVSMKQAGGSFAFNRLQRTNLLDVFKMLNFNNPENVLSKLDSEVNKFHDGLLNSRSRPWSECFSEEEFYQLTKFLMTVGSPNKGKSAYPADFIMVSPKYNITENNIEVFTFDEYFSAFKNSLTVSIRRQWYGQISESEHNRAKALMNKPGNQKWVYKNFTGQPNPRNGEVWRKGIPESERREVYFIMIEKH